MLTAGEGAGTEDTAILMSRDEQLFECNIRRIKKERDENKYHGGNWKVLISTFCILDSFVVR